MLEEAEANKAAGKYENTSIDYQIEFYRSEGLTPYSLAKLPITSGRCAVYSVMFYTSKIVMLVFAYVLHLDFSKLSA